MKTDQKEFVTHEELDVWGGEIMRQMDEIRDYIQSEVATKKDLERFATKEDLERFATKEDLERFATKEEFDRIWLILDEIRENTKK